MGTWGALGLAVISAALAFVAARLIEPFRTRQAWDLDNAKQFRDTARELLRSLNDVEAARDELLQNGVHGPEFFSRKADQLDLFGRLGALRRALANVGLFISPEGDSLVFSYIAHVTVWNNFGRSETRKPKDIKAFVNHAKAIAGEASEIHEKVAAEVLEFLSHRRPLRHRNG